MMNLKIKQLTHRVFYLLDARITKLNHFPTLKTNKVIMLLIAI